MDNRDTPYPLRMSPELREALEAMAANNDNSLHTEILSALYKAVEGFEVVENKEQAIKALRLQNELIQTIYSEQRNIIEFLDTCGD